MRSVKPRFSARSVQIVAHRCASSDVRCTTC
jgi:hypothetical protein